MRTFFAVFLIFAGFVLGVYVGLWLMFVGGIIAIVNAVQADPVNGSAIAWGIVRIVFASTAGGIVAVFLIQLGLKFWD